MTKLSCGQSLAALPTSSTVGVGAQVRELLLDRRAEQALVDADDVVMPAFTIFS